MWSASWLYPGYHAEAKYVPSLLLVGGVFALGLVWYSLALYTTKHQQWWLTVLLLVACSWGLALAWRCGFDHKTVGQVLSWNDQYRSFLFDPGIAVATGVSAYTLHRLYPNGGWFTSGWWGVAAYGGGTLVGFIVRVTLDYVAYKPHNVPLIFGVAKVFHDWWTWPDLASALIFFGVPLLFAHRWTNPLTYVPVLGLVAWMTIGLINGHDSKVDVTKVSNASLYAKTSISSVAVWPPPPSR